MQNNKVAPATARIGQKLSVERSAAGHGANLRRHYAVGMRADRVLVRVMIFVALTVGVVACAESDAGAPSTVATPAECPPADVADSVEITVQRAELLLGFSEADAQRCAAQLGWSYRVGQRDGESFAVTMDYSLQRVTVTVADDIVTAITVG
jgi:hypothetical protein